MDLDSEVVEGQDSALKLAMTSVTHDKGRIPNTK
jgi:hypothetical protein